MRHANGPEAELFIPAPGAAKYLYFPGCQMGASNPAYVTESFRWLRSHFPDDSALLLGCCGVPAYWSGVDDEGHREALNQIRSRWKESGSPVFLLACSTCAEMFEKHLPEIHAQSLWELMAEYDFPKRDACGTVSVFDPCSAKNNLAAKECVRILVQKSGYQNAELEIREGEARCCGFGGLSYSVNPEMFHRVNQRNIALGDSEFVTYCTNCRDNFAMHGKASRHILDLLFLPDPGTATRPAPGLTERRRNRELLKQQLITLSPAMKLQGESKPYEAVHLNLTGEIRAKMNTRLILEDDIKKVIHFAETTGAKIYDMNNDIYTAHQAQGNITFWVQYRPSENGYEIYRVYSHRLSIKEA
jgi:heterodisulfide reductase subunit B